MLNIAILGTGYIGLVIGATLADFGNKVTFADININKIDQLKNNIVPIYEPGINELINKNVLDNRIKFTTDVASAIRESSLVFITVGTPPGKDGKADTSAVKDVAEIIGKNLNDEKIICIKSTVPIGTHKIVESIIKKNSKDINFEVVSIPEFLREGSAINDFINPDRIIIGTKSEKTYRFLRKMFLSTNCNPDKIIWTDNLSAETIKYASNCFLALKISFINEIANFCDFAGIDALSVAKGIGLDKRIGDQFLRPGPGYGGSCFPKDVLALKKIAEDLGIELKMVNATLEINDLQKKHVVTKLKKFLNNQLEGKVIAIWGLAFKSNTDDIRESAAIDIIKQLIKEKAIIKAYDPEAMKNMHSEFPDIIYTENAYDAAKDADAVLLLTEWTEFKRLDFEMISQIMAQKNIFDTRNILDVDRLKKLDFNFESIGRSIFNKIYPHMKQVKYRILQDNFEY